MNVSIRQNFWDDSSKLYNKTRVNIDPGVTVLVGCNGSGKSTLLLAIEEHCYKKKIPCMKFDTLFEGGTHLSQKFLESDQTDVLVEYVSSSEGERITYAMVEFVRKINNFIDQNKSADSIFVLVDSVDSGLSLDNIVEMKRHIFHRFVDDCKEQSIDLYLITTTNTYEFAKNEHILAVPELNYVELPTYEEYRNLIIESRKVKNRRYGWGEFEDDQ